MAEGIPRWVKMAVPIAGLSIVPVLGFGYIAVASLGPSKAAASSASADLDPDSAGPGEAGPKGKSKSTGSKSSKSPKSKAPRDDVARLCCEKLVDLAQSAEIEQRSTYLNASKACESAESDDEALRQVASNLGLEKIDIPPECKGN